jgi:hypothetical protein
VIKPSAISLSVRIEFLTSQQFRGNTGQAAAANSALAGMEHQFLVLKRHQEQFVL